MVLAAVQILVAGQCGGDFNQDGTVNILDIVYQIDNYGLCNPAPCIADLTFDGRVNTFDVNLELQFFGPCPGAGGTTRPDATFPMPTTSTASTTTKATTTTRTTFATVSTEAPITTITRTTTIRPTTMPGSPPTTRPNDAIDLTFQPALAPNGDCDTVQPGAVLAYWIGPDSTVEGDCRGKPTFLVVPTVATGYFDSFSFPLTLIIPICSILTVFSL